ncbi:hypothetical protein RHGRI_012114 [Rhododendron griersonianum]|uniref:Uncharacterized protein n=1 Tax=Rhododendron griersonianum TaxID=479676 RepID=A0AAV6KP98_9ERIC|nr:hypothetical protein RHGRI_012114 [Rhododendron griersonianum]
MKGFLEVSHYLKIVSNASNLQMRPLWGLPKEAAEFLVDAVDVGRLLLIAVIALNESILFDMEYLKLIGYADLMVVIYFCSSQLLVGSSFFSILHSSFCSVVAPWHVM